MFSADLFYHSKTVLQKMKRNRGFLHVRVVLNKLNDAYLKINGCLAYFKIGNCTREPAVFFKNFKNLSLVVCQNQKIVFLTLQNTFCSCD